MTLWVIWCVLWAKKYPLLVDWKCPEVQGIDHKVSTNKFDYVRLSAEAIFSWMLCSSISSFSSIFPASAVTWCKILAYKFEHHWHPQPVLGHFNCARESITALLTVRIGTVYSLRKGMKSICPGFISNSGNCGIIIFQPFETNSVKIFNNHQFDRGSCRPPGRSRKPVPQGSTLQSRRLQRSTRRSMVDTFPGEPSLLAAGTFSPVGTCLASAWPL